MPVAKYAIDNKLCLRIFTYDFLYLLNKEYAPKNTFTYTQNKAIDYAEFQQLLDKIDVVKVAFSGEKEPLEIAKKELEKIT